MVNFSDRFNGSIQGNWAKDAGVIASIVTPLLAVTGLVYLSAQLLSFTRLILSLFVLPGKRVRPPAVLL